MVDFGLKLEDNKVAEWSNEYVNYEKLKGLLKKAKNAAERLAALEQRDPDLAAQVRASHVKSSSGRLSRSSSNSALPPSLSSESLHVLDIDTNLVNDIESANPSNRIESGEAGEEYGFYEESDSHQGHCTSSETQEEGYSEMVPLVFHSEDRNVIDDYGSLPSTEKSQPLGMKRSTSTGALGRVDHSGQFMSHNRSFVSEGEQLQTPGSVMKRTNSLTHLSATFAGYFQRDSASKLEAQMKEVDDSILEFSANLYQEMEKVNAFYKKKLDELKKRLDVLRESMRADSSAVQLGSKCREADSIRRALTDLYRTAKLLENYAIMNYTGFFKIIKKFDKNFPSNKGKLKDTFEKLVVHEGQEAEELGDDTEKVFAEWFCSGNIRGARAQILPKKGDSLDMDWSQMRLGYHLGMCSILALWVCWDCIWGLVKEGTSTIGARTAFPVFRACGGLLLLHWLWAFSVFMWTRYRVNYIFLFDFDPRSVRTPIMIFNDVVDETLVFLVLMLVYYKACTQALPDVIPIPPGGYPFILILYTLKKLFLPWRTRAPLWRAIRDVVTTPIKSPTFYTAYVADVFTSMVKVFQDLLWTVCFVASGDFLLSDDAQSVHSWQHQFWYRNILIPLICLAPLWFRFNQSLRRYVDTGKRWPNLANAFKYALSQTVTLFGAFHPLYLYVQKSNDSETDDSDGNVPTPTGEAPLYELFWMGLFVSSSLYSYFWDVYMDWGLGRPKYAFLGPRLMYPNRLHYYGVIAADLILRFMWVQSLIPPSSGASFEIPSYLSAVNMALELVRRTLWGLFRLENEHRHSTDGYRSVDFVPLHFSTGHQHKYKKSDERVGWHVLGEVLAVGLTVVAVMATSVFAAQGSLHS